MKMTTGITNDEHLEKQMHNHMGGCIAGFFNIFDRNHLLSPKRLNTKRLPASTFVDSTSDSVSSLRSPVPSVELQRPANVKSAPSPFDFKEGLKSPSKFNRDAPRLSLDSQADAKGKLRPTAAAADIDKLKRSPSVVARLMGLDELLPSYSTGACELPDKKSELRRSASESRSRDAHGFVTGNAFPVSQQHQSNSTVANNSNVNSGFNIARTQPWQQQRINGLYDAGDFFPEPKRALTTISSEIEKRLKMRGIQESAQDLETLNQIFEALQLKGLLHSNRPLDLVGRRNFIHEESPIVVMKTARSPRRVAKIEPCPLQSKSVSLRIPSGTTIGRQRRKKETTETGSRRVSSVQTPRNGSRRIGQVVGQSPRRLRSTDAISECSISTNDTEMLKMEELKEGKSLLERCDKLLNRISELHPSPVSVLDSSLYREKEECSPSPSPVMKRAIDFKDFEDDMWSPGGAFPLKSPDIDNNADDQQDPDFVYLSEILRVTNYLPEDSDAFQLLEKQQSINGRDTSSLKRKLIFDSVMEILDRHRQLAPWESGSSGPELRQIWSELQRIQVRTESEDLFQVICGVMKRDLAGEGWGECPTEMSKTVLDVERLIFKDLVGETIHSIAAVARENGVISASRRKLVF